MPPLKLHWARNLKKGRKNVGDWLSPVLVQHLSGCDVVYAAPNDCDLIAIGSMLQRVKHHFWNRRIHVWGTGFIAPQKMVPSRHYYHAIRGHESAALIKNAVIPAFGDPGLLVDRLLPHYATVTKQHRIGVIPHYKDQDQVQISEFIARTPHAITLDVLAEPEDFLHHVASCEFILSSSLHGLIVADAFHIPNAWIALSTQVIGGAFKFRDYYSIFGMNNPQSYDLALMQATLIDDIASQYRRPGLAAIQANLIKHFPFLKE